jgi:serine protease Do
MEARVSSANARFVAGFAMGLFFLARTAIAPPAENLGRVRPEVDAAVARVKPALVRIRVVSTSYSDGREMKSQAVGSGAIITKEGHIITNHHVAGRAVRIFCTLADREEMEAELIGTDPLTDICIIQLKPNTTRKFQAVEFGDSTKLRVGDPVLAMGSPMALSQSVTLGIISNVEMVMPRFFGPMGRLKQEGEDVGSLVRWIGHDAQIYGGNSGGPLVNLEGKIIGINEIRLGLSGAIPGNLAQRVAEKLIKNGKVARAWLGLEVQPLLKESSTDRGVLVSSVLEDSPAQKAGLRAGDLILRVGDKPVLVRYEEELPLFMAIVTDLPLGQETAFTVLSDGAEKTLRMTPTEREEIRPRQQELKQWGLTARNLSAVIAREMKRENRDGALVTSVRPGGPAGEAKPQIEPQDVIVQVNDKPVKSLRELTDITRQLTAGEKQPKPVLVTFERKDQHHVAVVKLGIQELKDPGLEATKAWLPVETQVMTRDIAAQLGEKDLKGYYVTRVYPNSTAEKAGLKAGDLIVAVDGEKLTADAPEHEEDLAILFRQYEPETAVDLTIVRGKERKVIKAELTRSPHLRREMKKYRNEDFEFVARDIGFDDKAEEQWSADQKGVMVDDVKAGGWAELGTLYTGDLILEVDKERVQSVDQLRPVMEKIAKAKKRFVTMKVLRGIHTKFLELEPKWTQ